MLPQISKLEFRNEKVIESPVTHKTFLWDFETGDFKLKDGKLVTVEGVEYIKIWISKVLRTEFGTLIYKSYGSEHHGLIGKVLDRDFIKSELQRTIREALLQNKAIISVTNFEFQLEEALLTIKLNVATIYGNTEVVIVAE
ncbi:Protein of unknown function [Natronincola peptidivorans]|uniref:DUF2634 domain-containing protein n=1 Tax=Natronincola peptidivorans TaxID=426128 RepID=A0A1I0FB35_9FIRM|nr:DUF2634 domain-containing protein [Natronincola peptidivorans]SET55350.1 Protein of unknown function [Natronincola peptidivorans]